MPIMGVAAVAGTVIPCAVSCKTGTNAESASVAAEVIENAAYIDEFNLGEYGMLLAPGDIKNFTQVNIETSVRETGELQAKIDWHHTTGLYMYAYATTVLVNGKVFVQKTPENAKGFSIVDYKRTGFTLVMADEYIPYNAEIKILLDLRFATYSKAIEVKNATEYQFTYLSNTKQKAVTTYDDSVREASYSGYLHESDMYRAWDDYILEDEDMEKVGYVFPEYNDYLEFSIDLSTFAGQMIVKPNCDLLIHFGYCQTYSTTQECCQFHEYDIYSGYACDNVYWGQIALETYVDTSDDVIVVKAPTGGWKTDGTMSEVTGWYRFGSSTSFAYPGSITVSYDDLD